VKDTIEKCEMIKNEGIKLKINSVITKLNCKEDMSWLIEKVKPCRWKVFQVLEIKERNSYSIQELLISKDEFGVFVKKHENFKVVSENNNEMIESYVMIDPNGRFYQNTGHTYIFSASIINVGLNRSLKEINYNHAKFIDKGGFYKW